MVLEVKLINDSVQFWHNPAWIGAISGLATGLAAIGFSFWNLRHQRDLSFFQVRTNIKEKWISEFKANVALFLTCSAGLNDSLKTGVTLRRRIEEGKADAEDIADEKEAFENFKKNKRECFELSHKIALFLNDTVPAHANFLKTMKQWSLNSKEWENEVFKDKVDAKAQKKLKDEGVTIQIDILTAAREIIKHELQDIIT